MVNTPETQEHAPSPHGKRLLEYVNDILDHPDEASIDPASAPWAIEPLAEKLALGNMPDQLTDASTFEALARALEKLAEKQERLRQDAYNDPLTGLPNGAGFKRASDAIWETGSPFVLAFIDMDNLKRCNDSFGHQEGNNYIQDVSKHLTWALKPDCQVFRIGGDEFIALTSKLSEEELSQQLEGCRLALIKESSKAKPMVHSFSFGCSTVDPTLVGSRTDITNEADRRMYRYKIEHRTKDLDSESHQRGLVAPYFCDDRVLETLALSLPGRYFVVKDLESGLTRFSSTAIRELGFPSSQTTNPEAFWMARVHPDDRETLKEDLEAVFSGKSRYHAIQYRALDAQDTYVVFESRGYRLEATKDSPALLVGVLANRNIAGSTDSVTGLGDAASLESCLAECRESQHPCGLIGIRIADLDEIAQANGPKTTDHLLALVAGRLLSCARARGIAHRTQGSRFVIVTRNATKAETQRMLDECLKSLQRPFFIEGKRFELQVQGALLHYGRVAVHPSVALAELMRRVDFAPVGNNVPTHHGSESGNFETLTGLRMNTDFIASAQKLRHEKPNIAWALVSIDLGNMSTFNEWHGFAKGDALLQEVALTLDGLEHEGDAVAGYWGQDDFSLLVPMDHELLERIRKNLCSLVAEHDESAGFRPSLGVYPLFATERLDIDCYARAVFANRQAKRDVRRPISFFRAVEYDKKRDETQLLSEFPFALADGHIFPVFQPQVEIATGKIIGAEVLSRWRKDDGSYISPARFIPVLERTGFVANLDKVIWEAAISQLADCLKQDVTPVPLSVNVSRIDIASFDVADFLERLIGRHRVPARYLKVEITETSFLEDMETMRDLTLKLQSIGIKVMMDDFGSGLSSLSMLRNINVDVIKLDGTFVPSPEPDEGEKGTNIMFSMLTLSNAVDTPLIVEGVEKASQVQLLRDLGAHYVQGFYFYRPMEAGRLRELLQQGGIVAHNGLRKPSEDAFDL
ncbi:MAG: EAL domain-containing protein [Coriobacteriia bacterium]|nr:EAL domain-containing protein [Coriobacteriia bacterium]